MARLTSTSRCARISAVPSRSLRFAPNPRSRQEPPPPASSPGFPRSIRTPSHRAYVSMRVLFATSECTPLAKAGGLGDVSAALPAALRALGIEVDTLLPGYAGVLEKLGEAS